MISSLEKIRELFNDYLEFRVHGFEFIGEISKHLRKSYHGSDIMDIEKKMDEWQKQNAEMRAEHQAQVINQKLDALKEKERKGLLEGSDYSLYIVRYLESIDHTLKFKDGKNTREWLIVYYKAVRDIPDYFSPQEWKESEKLIYENMLQEIDGHFNMRGTFDSGMHKKLLEMFKNERDRLIKAKEREFNN